MSIKINNVITHLITLNEQSELTLSLRNQALDNQTPQSESFAIELHRIYTQKPKGFAAFNEESDFFSRLEHMRGNKTGFIEFTQAAATNLKNELCKYPFADTGVLTFIEYTNLAAEYLLIALLPLKSSIRLDDGLDINIIEYVDFNQITIAARINLTDLETKSSERPVTFIHGRVGRRVSDFFLDFLNVRINFDPKMQNQVLKQALDDFCNEGKLERDEKLQLKRSASDYCKEQIASNDEISIKELSAQLPPAPNGESFETYVTEHGYELAESFPADKATVRSLTKYIGAGGGLNISFDSLLLGERVFYDIETDTLTIKGTPPNLRDQLART